MKRIDWFSPATLTLAAAFFAAPAPVRAQCETYRIVYQTVYDEQQVTAYRIESETVYEERQVTSYRPVYETESRERRYTVARPVVETSEREERYRVLRPVWETQVRDASYDRVRDVVETSDREERYIVNRPVVETGEREERYVVRRQVIETAEREECSTVLEPVTTYRTAVVDQGGFVDHQVCRPGAMHTSLRWVPGACVVDPCTGASAYQRGGLAWIQQQGPSRVEVLRTWQPNLVTHQIPQTNYVQKVVTHKVPVQVCRYVDEEQVRKIPVQVTRMVQEEQVRRIPVTTVRQVVERVPQQVSYQVCKMVEEEHVRKVPITTCKTVYEERVEQVPVQVCKMVAVQETLRTPHLVEKRVPVTYTCRTPRVVAMRVPLESACCDTTVHTGVQIVQPGAVVSGAPGSVQERTTFGQQEPTKAKPEEKNNGSRLLNKDGGKDGNGDANKRPELGKDEKVNPSPVDEDNTEADGQSNEKAPESDTF